MSGKCIISSKKINTKHQMRSNPILGNIWSWESRWLSAFTGWSEIQKGAKPLATFHYIHPFYMEKCASNGNLHSEVTPFKSRRV